MVHVRLGNIQERDPGLSKYDDPLFTIEHVKEHYKKLQIEKKKGRTKNRKKKEEKPKVKMGHIQSIGSIE